MAPWTTQSTALHFRRLSPSARGRSPSQAGCTAIAGWRRQQSRCLRDPSMRSSMSNTDLLRAFAVPVLLMLLRLVSASEMIGEIAYILVPAWSLGRLLRRRSRSDRPSAAWGLLTAGFACLAIAEFYWFSEDLFDIEYYPGPGEYLSALALLVMTVGFWRTAARVAPVGDKTDVATDAESSMLRPGAVLRFCQSSRRNQTATPQESLLTSLSPVGLRHPQQRWIASVSSRAASRPDPRCTP